MKVLIDSNVIISAALNSDGAPASAFILAVSKPNHAVVCEQTIDEVLEVIAKKFPEKLSDFEEFFSLMKLIVEIVPVPKRISAKEKLIRDDTDKTILRAAIAAKADVILTGDKDFLESGIENPRMLGPADFIREYADA